MSLSIEPLAVGLGGPLWTHKLCTWGTCVQSLYTYVDVRLYSQDVCECVRACVCLEDIAWYKSEKTELGIGPEKNVQVRLSAPSSGTLTVCQQLRTTVPTPDSLIHWVLSESTQSPG